SARGCRGEDRKSATPVVGLTQAVALAAGGDHTCAVKRDGGVACWGSNAGGALGNGIEGDETEGVAVAVRNLTGVTDIASGEAFTCALSGGAVQCWGAGNMGQLGDGSKADRGSADEVLGIDDAVQIAAGRNHACARRRTGGVACWGQNGRGQLGDGGKQARARPVAVAGLSDAVQLGAGQDHTCAARRSGQVVCWGRGAE